MRKEVCHALAKGLKSPKQQKGTREIGFYFYNFYVAKKRVQVEK